MLDDLYFLKLTKNFNIKNGINSGGLVKKGT